MSKHEHEGIDPWTVHGATVNVGIGFRTMFEVRHESTNSRWEGEFWTLTKGAIVGKLLRQVELHRKAFDLPDVEWGERPYVDGVFPAQHVAPKKRWWKA